MPARLARRRRDHRPPGACTESTVDHRGTGTPVGTERGRLADGVAREVVSPASLAWRTRTPWTLPPASSSGHRPLPLPAAAAEHDAGAASVACRKRPQPVRDQVHSPGCLARETAHAVGQAPGASRPPSRPPWRSAGDWRSVRSPTSPSSIRRPWPTARPSSSRRSHRWGSRTCS